MATTPTDTPVVVAVASDPDVVRVRQVVREVAVAARLSLVDQTKLVTAASELARNTLMYGGGGEAIVRLVERGVGDGVERGAGRTARHGGVRGVEVVFTDQGPGIHDVEQALTDGWTTGSGMGLGLSGARRLVDEFDLKTAPGSGTRVRVVKWRR